MALAAGCSAVAVEVNEWFIDMLKLSSSVNEFEGNLVVVEKVIGEGVKAKFSGTTASKNWGDEFNLNNDSLEYDTTTIDAIGAEHDLQVRTRERDHQSAPADKRAIRSFARLKQRAQHTPRTRHSRSPFACLTSSSLPPASLPSCSACCTSRLT